MPRAPRVPSRVLNRAPSLVARLLPRLAFATLLLPVAACSEQTGPIDTGCGSGDDGYLIFNRQQNLLSRTMYLTVCPSLEAGELDNSQALEAPGFSRARSYEGKIYVFNGEAAEISRYSVDDDLIVERENLSEEEQARMSVSSLGISSFTNASVILSPTRAYYIDFFVEPRVVVWNPETMTLTGTFPVEGLIKGDLTTNVGNVLHIDDLVVFPAYFVSGDNAEVEEGVHLFVLSATEDRVVDVIVDDRSLAASNAFTYNGDVYVVADAVSGLANLERYALNLPGPAVLRWTPGNDAFDADYFVDLASALDVPAVTGGVGTAGGRLLTLAYTSSTDPNDLEVFDYYDGDYWELAEVDLLSGEGRVTGALPPGPISAPGWLIDGEVVVPRSDNATGRASLYRIDLENGASTELFSVPGELFHLERIR